VDKLISIFYAYQLNGLMINELENMDERKLVPNLLKLSFLLLFIFLLLQLQLF